VFGRAGKSGNFLEKTVKWVFSGENILEKRLVFSKSFLFFFLRIISAEEEELITPFQPHQAD